MTTRLRPPATSPAPARRTRASRLFRACARAAAGTALAVIPTACIDAAAPPLPDNAVQFAPPPVYSHWWQMTEQCSAMQGPLSRVSWYVVPGVSKVFTGEGTGSAYWSRRGNRIVLAGSVQFDGPTVRHEMLHALRQTDGHPRGEFLHKCAGIVNCFPHCVTEAGMPANSNWDVPPVSARDLDISMSVNPAVPDGSVRGGFFTVTVVARNPAPFPVRLVLARSGQAWTTFAVRVANPSRFYQDFGRSHDGWAGHFEPGESKRHVFDVQINPSADVWAGNPPARLFPPGTYQVSGSYDGHWVAGPVIEIAQ